MRSTAALFTLLVGPAAAAADITPPSITHLRVAEVIEGEPLAVDAEIEDDSAIFEPSVYLRSSGMDRYRRSPMAEVGPGRFRAIVPPKDVQGVIEYFIEAFDEHGNGPSRAGTPDAPFRVTAVPPPPPVAAILPEVAPVSAEDRLGLGEVAPSPKDSEERGVHEQWWFWTLIGVAAAGAAIAVTVAVQPTPRDFVSARITGPDPARDL